MHYSVYNATCVVPMDEAMWGGVCRQGKSRWMVVSVQCRSGEGDDFMFSSITVNVRLGSTGVVYLQSMLGSASV